MKSFTATENMVSFMNAKLKTKIIYYSIGFIVKCILIWIAGLITSIAEESLLRYIEKEWLLTPPQESIVKLSQFSDSETFTVKDV